MLHTACKLIFISMSLYCLYQCVALDDLRCGTKATKQIFYNDRTGNKISHYWVGVSVPLCKLLTSAMKFVFKVQENCRL